MFDRHLMPLDGITIEAVQKVDPDHISPAAGIVRHAALTGEKPTPEGGGAYVVNMKGPHAYLVLSEYRPLYKRQKTPLGSLVSAARELAAAALPLQNGSGRPVDIQRTADALRPESRPRRSVPASVNRQSVIDAINDYWRINDMAPLYKDVAAMSGLDVSSVRRHVRKLIDDGIVEYNGTRTMRVKNEDGH